LLLEQHRDFSGFSCILSKLSKFRDGVDERASAEPGSRHRPAKPIKGRCD
jgi:hypothetical protein